MKSKGSLETVGLFFLNEFKQHGGAFTRLKLVITHLIINYVATL